MELFIFVVGAYSIDVSEVDAEVVFGFCGGGVSDEFVVALVWGEGGLDCGGLSVVRIWVDVVGVILWWVECDARYCSVGF